MKKFNATNAKGPGCDSETKSWGKSSCGVVSGSHPGVCVKVNYKDQSSKPMVERKCMTTEIKDGKPIYSCSVDNGVVTECSKCQTDLCNSATSVRVSLLTLFSIFE
ncbi:hypothetical protein NQ317_006598 [Molorchus minor]|uniref:Protein sleepless n=1 Tax=Molorchus minor TaxID=1323400 RepID=A0ABQ9JYZ0_9CUCU|nr:hypothetical protein NQ317_006598 [Molorchus minor]